MSSQCHLAAHRRLCVCVAVDGGRSRDAAGMHCSSGRAGVVVVQGMLKPSCQRGPPPLAEEATARRQGRKTACREIAVCSRGQRKQGGGACWEQASRLAGRADVVAALGQDGMHAGIRRAATDDDAVGPACNTHPPAVYRLRWVGGLKRSLAAGGEGRRSTL